MKNANIPPASQVFYLIGDKVMLSTDMSTGKDCEECWRLLEQRFGSRILCSSSKLNICFSGKPIIKVGLEIQQVGKQYGELTGYLEESHDHYGGHPHSIHAGSIKIF